MGTPLRKADAVLSADEAAFIDRIREDHADDLPRLIYADWLDERGDQPRADFIRVQCALAKLPRDDPAAEQLRVVETALTDAHAAAWGRDIDPLVEGFSFRRGLIEAVTVTPGQFAKLNDGVFARYPIRRLRFVRLTSAAFKVFQSPLLKYAAELDFSGFPLDAVTATAVGRSRFLRNLDLLDLGYTGIDAIALRMLTHSPAVARLKTLRINGNHPLADNGLRAVFESQSLAALETLDLSDNHLTVRQLDAMLYVFDALPALKFVPLRGNRLGEGLTEFVHSPVFDHLVTHDPDLDLTANEIGPAGVEMLINGPAAGKIRSLNLSHNPIRDAGLSAIARTAYAEGLTRLSLVKCGVSDDSVRELANSPLMGRLVELDVQENLVTQEAVDRLTEMSRRKLKVGTLRIRADANLPKSRSAMPTLRAFLQQPPG